MESVYGALALVILLAFMIFVGWIVASKRKDAEPVKEDACDHYDAVGKSTWEEYGKGTYGPYVSVIQQCSQCQALRKYSFDIRH